MGQHRQLAETTVQTRLAFPKGLELLVEKLQQELVPPGHTKEWFDWQALSLNSFYSGMFQVREKLGPGKHKFLDVGSGIGTKLFLAAKLGFEPYGIERREDYAEVSRRLFPKYPVHVVNALDYTEYGQFDVIYSYRCARKDELQNQFHRHIMAHLKEGAIYFPTDTAETLDQLNGTSA